MGRCRFRPLTYRIGVFLLLPAFLLVAAGYGLPYWLRFSRGWTQGLWHICSPDKPSPSGCTLLDNVDVFLMVVRALVGVCLGLYIMAFTMALRENCCAPTFYTCTLAGRKTEVFAFLAEIFGFAGIIVYSIDEFTMNGNLIRLSWAHALCGLGLFLSLIGSIMMACSQQSLPAAKAAAGRIIAKAPGYENLGHNRSASLQSRTTIKTQMSPYQGRSAPVISGPYPSAAAAAAASATVSPKPPRAAATVTATGGSQSEAVHGGRTSTSMHSLDAPASPSRRRTSGAGQERQFAGVHNQGKHPPLFANQHFPE
ncbi:uncharacterized protein LOC112569804 [Pomacea canaliculata]|nr:uncharacterized protein LOC112569804 [Pomacea canaliculata]